MVAGQYYLGQGWIRPDTANKNVRISLIWYAPGPTYVANTSTEIPAVAGVWMFVSVVAAASLYPTATMVTVGLGLMDTPAGTDAYYVDSLELRVGNVDKGSRIATLLPSGATLTDGRAAARTSYEYRVVTYGANGSQIAGPWTL